MEVPGAVRLHVLSKAPRNCARTCIFNVLLLQLIGRIFILGVLAVDFHSLHRTFPVNVICSRSRQVDTERAMASKGRASVEQGKKVTFES